MNRFKFAVKGCVLGLGIACVCASGTVVRAGIWSGFDEFVPHADFPIISGGLTGARNSDTGKLEGGLVSSEEGNWENVTLAWYIESQAGQAYPVQFRYNYYIEVEGENQAYVPQVMKPISVQFPAGYRP